MALASWQKTLLILGLVCPMAHGDDTPPGIPLQLPPSVSAKWASSADESADALGVFEGLPYRRDGMISDEGHFALWEAQFKDYQRPGLNCSGHVLSVARLLTDLPLVADDMMSDINEDSDALAPRGADWDFGWDLIVNIALAATEGDLSQAVYFDPQGHGQTLDPASLLMDGANFRGFRVKDAKAWQQALGELQEDYFYLGSFSRVGRKGPRRLLHHHTVLFVVRDNEVWVQGASPYNPTGPRVESLPLSDPTALAQFKAQFKAYNSEHLLIIGVPLKLHLYDLQPPNGP